MWMLLWIQALYSFTALLPSVAGFLATDFTCLAILPYTCRAAAVKTKYIAIVTISIVPH